MTTSVPAASRRGVGTAAVSVCVTGAVLALGAAIGRAAGLGGSTLLGGELVVAGALAGVALLALATDASWGVLMLLTASLFAAAAPGPGGLHWQRVALGALTVAWLAEVRSGRRRVAPPGVAEALMAAFLLIEVGSAIAPHELPAISSSVSGTPAAPISIVDAIEHGAFVPFAAYFLARQTIDSQARIVRLLWFLVAIGVYVGLTNVFEEVGPHALVFPRVILDPGVGLNETDRARGVFLNAAPTGTALALALAAALHLAAQRSVPRRRLALPAAAAIIAGLYYTHERGPLLSTLVVLVGAALVGPRSSRRWLALLLAVIAVAAAANRHTLGSSERAHGGLGSAIQIQDRLNIEATGLWAVGQKPLLGWGLGRYGLVNTYDHRAWGDTPWLRGYGDIAHDTAMGIAVELGLIGLAAWCAVLGAVVAVGARAWRALPESGVVSRELVVAFALAAAAWLVNASLIDIRLFALPTSVVFAWAGALAALTARAHADASRTRRRGSARSGPDSPSSASVAR
jgi:O-antigen ligase